MSDSSVANSQIQLDAIRQEISQGQLTAEQMHCILLKEITNELSKSEKEVDTEYINACQELLTVVNKSRATAVFSHYEKNLLAIQNKLQPRFSFFPHTGWGRIATIMCIALIILCVGIFIPEGRIITHYTEDEGQYIMQGIETPAGFSSVADAGPALNRIGTYEATSWQEVVHLMGGKPCVPQWMPSEWSILTYDVGLTSTTSTLTIIYINDNTEKTQIFQSTTYFELSSLHRYIEQNNEGYATELENGITVYIADNIDNISATWNNSSTDYLLSGSIPANDLLRIVESMD